MAMKMKGFTCKKGYWYSRMKGEQEYCGYENNAGLKTKKRRFNRIKDLLRSVWQKEITINNKERG